MSDDDLSGRRSRLADKADILRRKSKLEGEIKSLPPREQLRLAADFAEKRNDRLGDPDCAPGDLPTRPRSCAMSAMIVIEGLDAVGKQRQSKMLAARLDSLGWDAVLMAFPRYETPVGQAIRRHLTGDTFLGEQLAPYGIGRAKEDPMVLQALFLADRFEASIEIERHLSVGRTVICDRWVPSGICYGAADGLDPSWLERIHAQLPAPDLSILIDVPEEEALRRRPELRDRYERDREKQAVVRANYDRLWTEKAATEMGWVRVDGVGTWDEVSARIWTYVGALIR